MRVSAATQEMKTCSQFRPLAKTGKHRHSSFVKAVDSHSQTEEVCHIDAHLCVRAQAYMGMGSELKAQAEASTCSLCEIS